MWQSCNAQLLWYDELLETRNCARRMAAVSGRYVRAHLKYTHCSTTCPHACSCCVDSATGMDLQDGLGGVRHKPWNLCRSGAHIKSTAPTGRAHGALGGTLAGVRRTCEPVGFLQVPPLPPLRTQYASAKARGALRALRHARSNLNPNHHDT
jgi:hypothetical protein